jgi:malonyl-CoA O-methyltransferase
MSDQTTQYIEPRHVRRAFDRAANSYDAAAVLQNEVCERLLEKLQYVKLTPHRILDAGTGTGEAIRPLQKLYRGAEVVALDISEQMLRKAATRSNWLRPSLQVCADIEALPFADDSFDLVFSSLSLQWCNDLDAALQNFMRILKPGGLLVFTSFGPDTLKELRHSWQVVDAALHVNQFIDMHDVGDALVRAHFADPVMEAEIIRLQYSAVDGLLADLRAIGANVTAQGHRRGLLTAQSLQRLRDAYETYREAGSLPASYEVIYGHAWKADLDAKSPDRVGEVQVKIEPRRR